MGGAASRQLGLSRTPSKAESYQIKRRIQSVPVSNENQFPKESSFNQNRGNGNESVEVETMGLSQVETDSDSEVSILSGISEGVPNDTKDACDDQRRITYLEVPVGPSSMLTKKVFEVRQRKVEPCHPDRVISLSKPYCSHATTNMLVIRWDLANWIDAKRCFQQELQWCQAAHTKNQFFKAFAEEVDISVSSPKEQLEERLNRSPLFLDEETTEKVKPRSVEIFCDNRFSTIPRSVVRITDTRCEIVIKGLPKQCNPFRFRVRAKVQREKSKFSEGNPEYEKAGWGTWSPVSDEIQPLSSFHENLNPRLLLQTAHSFKLFWDPPDSTIYGKVITYRLFGKQNRKAKRSGRTKSPKNNNSSSSVTDDDADWSLLYEGSSNTFCVGQTPELAVENYREFNLEDDIDKELTLLSSIEDKMYIRANFENDTNSECLIAASLLTGIDGCCYLPQDSVFDFKVQADTGSWFNGMFLTNKVNSYKTSHKTLRAIPDRPQPVQLTPYHGSNTINSLELKWSAPTTYGNGHNFETFRMLFDLLGKAKYLENHDWHHVRKVKEELELVEAVNLKSEGWVHKPAKEGAASYWYNSLTGETSWNFPTLEAVPVSSYVLYGKVSSLSSCNENHWKSFQIKYEGNLRKHIVADLKPNTEYVFVLLVRACFKLGQSTISRPFLVKTIEKTRTRTPGELPSDPDMPAKWKECWDSVSEYCYYYNENTKEFQWTHPGGKAALDDPNLIFRKKRFKFQNLQIQRRPRAPQYETIKLNINRKNILTDSFNQIACLNKELMNRRTNITFQDEDGIDSGGITTEWYMQLSRKFFDESVALLQKKESGLYVFAPLPDADSDFSAKELHCSQLNFMGRIVAKALYDNQILDMPFGDFFYGYLLDLEPTMEELEQLDQQFYSSIKWLLENDITGILFEDFTIIVPGGIREKDKRIELVENGSKIEVNEENKKEYARLVLKWHLRHQFQEQFSHFATGFFDLVSKEDLKAFSILELKHLINGSSKISVLELRRSAVYVGYKKSSKPVEYFWQVMEELSQQNRSYLLAFVTGCPKMPLDELCITISKTDSSPDSLPTTHTCFNQIYLPVYETKAQLQEKLFLAMENSTGFFLT